MDSDRFAYNETILYHFSCINPRRDRYPILKDSETWLLSDTQRTQRIFRDKDVIDFWHATILWAEALAGSTRYSSNNRRHGRYSRSWSWYLYSIINKSLARGASGSADWRCNWYSRYWMSYWYLILNLASRSADQRHNRYSIDVDAIDIRHSTDGFDNQAVIRYTINIRYSRNWRHDQYSILLDRVQTPWQWSN